MKSGWVAHPPVQEMCCSDSCRQRCRSLAEQRESLFHCAQCSLSIHSRVESASRERIGDRPTRPNTTTLFSALPLISMDNCTVCEPNDRTFGCRWLSQRRSLFPDRSRPQSGRNNLSQELGDLPWRKGQREIASDPQLSKSALSGCQSGGSCREAGLSNVFYRSSEPCFSTEERCIR